MEAFAVIRHYYNYEDSYTEVIGLCYTEDKCKEVIENDKHKHDHPLMDKKTYYECMEAADKAIKRLANEEANSPKHGGFLNKFHYQNLNKVGKNAYDILKKKYDGITLTYDIMIYELSPEDRFYLGQLLTNYFDNITYKQFDTVRDHYVTYHENPDRIHYEYQKFEIQ